MKKRELKNMGLHLAFLVTLYCGVGMIYDGNMWLGAGFILFGYIVCYVFRWLIEDLLNPAPKDNPYIPREVKDKIINTSEQFESFESSRKRLEKSRFKLNRFNSKHELRHHIDMHMPFAIKPTKKAKTTLIDPFTSQNARNICVDAIVESLIEK